MKFIRVLKAEQNLKLVLKSIDEFETYGITYNSQLELWNNNTLEDVLLLNKNDIETDQDILEVAREHFGNLPDNIEIIK